MDISKRIGHYITSTIMSGESYKSYIPANLPFEPPLNMDALYPLLDKANTALGRLDGMSMLLPDTSLFLYMYVRKEAVLSSQIEGTQSSLSDLLLFENKETPGVPIDDVTEVSCYVSALDYGLKRLQEIPLSLRLIKEIHHKLMQNTRGSNKQPGEFRIAQNWIGGTHPNNAHFVPPSPEHLMNCLDNFEKFLHDDKVHLPVLIKAAIAHAQFETIHPFLDGNGRLGRLLITFILCNDGILEKPLLYLSLFLKTNRNTYYDLLQSIRTTGDWEAWIEFFLKGVIATANQATQTTKDIIELFKADMDKIEKSTNATNAALTVYRFLQQKPISNTTNIKDQCNISLPTVLRATALLEELGIVKEITGKDRHKIFVYSEYLYILNKGSDPLSY